MKWVWIIIMSYFSDVVNLISTSEHSWHRHLIWVIKGLCDNCSIHEDISDFEYMGLLVCLPPTCYCLDLPRPPGLHLHLFTIFEKAHSTHVVVFVGPSCHNSENHPQTSFNSFGSNERILIEVEEMACRAVHTNDDEAAIDYFSPILTVTCWVVNT